jgi:uncharacterized protein YgiB involved in biofilm formation
LSGYDKRADEGQGAYAERLIRERDEAREVARDCYRAAPGEYYWKLERDWEEAGIDLSWLDEAP